MFLRCASFLTSMGLFDQESRHHFVSLVDLNEIDSDVERLIKERKQLDAINDTKKFFYNFNVDELIEQELTFDIANEDLEVLSDSEIQDDTRYLLEENHFEIC